MVAIENDFYLDQQTIWIGETQELSQDAMSHRYFPKIQNFSHKLDVSLYEKPLSPLVEDLEFVVTMENTFQNSHLYPGECGIYPNTLFNGIGEKILKTRMLLVLAKNNGFVVDQNRLINFQEILSSEGFWDFRELEFDMENYLKELTDSPQMKSMWREIEEVWDSTTDHKEDVFLHRIIAAQVSCEEALKIVEAIELNPEGKISVLKKRVLSFYKQDH
jgi:hypothetical protein